MLRQRIRRDVAPDTFEAEALKGLTNPIAELPKLLKVDALAGDRLGFHLLALYAHQGATARKLALTFREMISAAKVGDDLSQNVAEPARFFRPAVNGAVDEELRPVRDSAPSGGRRRNESGVIQEVIASNWRKRCPAVVLSVAHQARTGKICISDQLISRVFFSGH